MGFLVRLRDCLTVWRVGEAEDGPLLFVEPVSLEVDAVFALDFEVFGVGFGNGLRAELEADFRANKFNGASSNYDGNGRNAKDNDTLYLLAWLAF